MNNRWNLAVWRQDPWSSEWSFNMFDDSSIHEFRSSATRSFWHNLQESLPKVFEQLKGSPCQRMLQDSSSRSMPALGIESLLRCHICAKWMARVQSTNTVVRLWENSACFTVKIRAIHIHSHICFIVCPRQLFFWRFGITEGGTKALSAYRQSP
jgi:hypothetical protein